MAHYVYLLHNRGETLQSRPDHMVLTRNLYFLVKGASASHVATTCRLEGYACLTEAHAAVEATAVNEIMQEVARCNETDVKPCTLLHVLKQAPCPPQTFAEIVKLAQQAGMAPSVPLMVNVMLAAAVIHTGFSDAGAKFRDRTARHEAGRHLGLSIKSLLLAVLVPS